MKVPLGGASRLVLVVGIILVAFNLRSPITSVGPVILELQQYFGLSSGMAGFITTVPLLAFAVFSPIAPFLAARYYISNVIWVAMISILLGLILRVNDYIGFLYLGTALIGAGIAMCNVLMPPFIKREFPNNMGLMTGVYSVSMNITASLASGLSIFIGVTTGYGWKGSLGLWIIFAILAVLIWLPQVISARSSSHKTTVSSPNKKSFVSLPKAWFITLFMGIQSLLFYCSIAWFPVVMQSWGMSSEEAGWALSFIQFSQLPVVFIAPIIIGKMESHVPLLFLIGSILTTSLLLLLLFKSTWVVLAVILYGIGTGLAFSLIMMWFVLRTRSTGDSARLSGMAQSFGYAIAAIAPPVFGILYDYTGEWDVFFVILIAMVILLVFSGLPASNSGYVDEAKA